MMQGSSKKFVKGFHSFSDTCELHKGRHSTVWSAKESEESEDVVVVKGYSRLRLKPRQLSNVTRELLLLRYFRKARLGGVVQLQSSFEEQECVYLVCDACMHGNLYQVMLTHRHSLNEAFIASKVVHPLLSTLALLHSLRIAHRDVKPENVFVSSAGEIILGDFGLAAHCDLDKMSERVGTLDYMAPEVMAMPTPDFVPASSAPYSRKRYNEKVDVWAVGILVYEMLTGTPPFEVEDPKETARLIMESQVTVFPPGMSPLCQDFILKALEKSPSKRASAAELLQHPWVQGYLNDVSPREACPEDVKSALKKLLHKSWTTTSLEDLLDPVESLCPENLQDPSSPRLSDPVPSLESSDLGLKLSFVSSMTEPSPQRIPSEKAYICPASLASSGPLDYLSMNPSFNLKGRPEEKDGSEPSQVHQVGSEDDSDIFVHSNSTPITLMGIGKLPPTLEESLGLSPRISFDEDGHPRSNLGSDSSSADSHMLAGMVIRSFSLPGEENMQSYASLFAAGEDKTEISKSCTAAPSGYGGHSSLIVIGNGNGTFQTSHLDLSMVPAMAVTVEAGGKRSPRLSAPEMPDSSQAWKHAGLGGMRQGNAKSRFAQ